MEFNKLDFLARNGDPNAMSATSIAEILDFEPWAEYIMVQPKPIRVLVAYLAACLTEDHLDYGRFLNAIRNWLKNPTALNYNNVCSEYAVIDELFVRWSIDHPGQGSIYYHIYYAGAAVIGDIPWSVRHVLNAVGEEIGKNETMEGVKKQLMTWGSKTNFSTGFPELE